MVLALCLTATGSIASWCWWLWALSGMQAATAILVIRARLQARMALRNLTLAVSPLRHAAIYALGLLALAASLAAVSGRGRIALALALAVLAWGMTCCANAIRPGCASRCVASVTAPSPFQGYIPLL